MTRRQRLAAGAVALACGGMLLAGCGGPDDAGGTATTTPATPTTPSGTASSSAQATSIPTPTKTIATKAATVGAAGSSGRGRWTFQLYELRRNGQYVTLDFGAKNETDALSTFGDDLGRGGASNVSGVYLVDGKNKKKHLPATYRDPAHPGTGTHCLCTNTRGVAGGQTFYLNATFAAPPDDITSVDVTIPHVGTFKDVPIT